MDSFHPLNVSYFRSKPEAGHRHNMSKNVISTLKDMTHFYQCLRLCSYGTKPQHSENHHFVMTSSWEPQCHHDIIMRTPRIMG